MEPRICLKCPQNPSFFPTAKRMDIFNPSPWIKINNHWLSWSFTCLRRRRGSDRETGAVRTSPSELLAQRYPCEQGGTVASGVMVVVWSGGGRWGSEDKALLLSSRGGRRRCNLERRKEKARLGRRWRRPQPPPPRHDEFTTSRLLLILARLG